MVQLSPPLILERSHQPRKKPHTPSGPVPLPSAPQPSASLKVVLYVSYKRGCTYSVWPRLALFTRHVSEVPLCCGRSPPFILIASRAGLPHFLDPSMKVWAVPPLSSPQRTLLELPWTSYCVSTCSVLPSVRRLRCEITGPTVASSICPALPEGPHHLTLPPQRCEGCDCSRPLDDSSPDFSSVDALVGVRWYVMTLMSISAMSDVEHLCMP